jgi:5-methylcytosine-specific restriction endonuclease McrA
MAHRNPSRDFAPIVDKALDLLIAELKKERFGQTTRPQRSRKAKPKRVTNVTKREVLERDGLRCAYVDEQGKRCTARAFLERDHRVPRGKGGGSEPENIRHLCRPHNQYVAEIEYGRAHIARKGRRRERSRPLRSGRTQQDLKPSKERRFVPFGWTDERIRANEAGAPSKRRAAAGAAGAGAAEAALNKGRPLRSPRGLHRRARRPKGSRLLILAQSQGCSSAALSA